MKNLRHFCAIFTLIVALSSITFAGQMDAPPVASAPPPPPAPTVYGETSDEAAGATESGPLTEIAVSLIQSLLSVF